jgi:selenocysteine-specific elongation factor
MIDSDSGSHLLHAIVGTAGHVDHGKTELVGRLTGFDTDRLPEEKRRGMSIDLGFAPYTMADGRVFGIVDVPGHKDFVRNMVAGAASVDVLMLVVAADDGIMPQTEEHMRIVSMLRTPRVMAVVTKIDLVPDDGRAKLRQDVAQFLGRMGYGAAPIVLMSNRTGEGMAETKRTLELVVQEAVAALQQGEHGQRAFRMNIERVFTVKGRGTVVTGIPLSGEVGVDDRLDLLPAGQQTGVRSIEAYRRATQGASANACIAINLRDVAPDSVRRGMTLAAPGFFSGTVDLLATLRNASDTSIIRHRAQVRLHSGTSATTASLGLLGTSQLAPGEEGFVRVRLEEPVVLAVGDRFVVRSLSPAFTLGGGSVLSTGITRMRRSAAPLLAGLAQARTALDQGDLLATAIAAKIDPLLSHRELLRLTQLPEDLAAIAISRQQAEGAVVCLGEDWLVTARRSDLVGRLKLVLQHHHQSNKYAWGMQPRQVCKLLGIGPKSFTGLAQELGRADAEIIVQHGALAIRGHRPALSDQQLRSKDELVRRVLTAKVSPPAQGDLKTALGLPQLEMNLLLRLLREEGVVTVLRSHIISSEAFNQCRDKLLALFAEHSVVDIATFRNATGTSRRVAVEILEAFDQQVLTRRTDDGRVLASGKPERPGEAAAA